MREDTKSRRDFHLTKVVDSFKDSYFEGWELIIRYYSGMLQNSAKRKAVGI
jgi:hypothetical protein